jgi:alpha/beta superfamily hydrolase
MAVPVQYSIDAAEKYDNAKLVLIENDDHNYHAHLDQVCAAVQEFVRTL